jgi:sialate O-acetylesterase
MKTSRKNKSRLGNWHKVFVGVLLTAPCLGASSVMAAKLTPAPLFSDHMVLQAGMPTPVWGAADAGATVTVEFAGQTKTATADDKGEWRVTMDAAPFSTQGGQ